jgi:hypothetical protein
MKADHTARTGSRLISWAAGPAHYRQATPAMPRPASRSDSLFAPDLLAEVDHIARLLIKRYGERSTSFAELQALRARENAQRTTSDAWHWIATTTREILRSDPE